MFSLGVMLLTLGYAEVYTAIANLRNGGNGPRLTESLGFAVNLAPPGSEQPNLTGQPPLPHPDYPGPGYQT